MLYVIGASTTRTDEAARARVAPSMAFDADSANRELGFAAMRFSRFPVPHGSLLLRDASVDGWAGRPGDDARVRVRQPLARPAQLLRAHSLHIAAPFHR